MCYILARPNRDSHQRKALRVTLMTGPSFSRWTLYIHTSILERFLISTTYAGSSPKVHWTSKCPGLLTELYHCQCLWQKPSYCYQPLCQSFHFAQGRQISVLCYSFQGVMSVLILLKVLLYPLWLGSEWMWSNSGWKVLDEVSFFHGQCWL